jgi:predicted membrane channel-forming protein YqfA (hemolysin III family)
MALSYKARRRWSLVILLIGLPIYVVVAVNLVDWLERPAIWLELLIYVALGFLWMLPFKFVFQGVGQADPDAPADMQKADREPPSA